MLTAFLRDVSLFTDLPEEMLQELAGRLGRVHVAAGQSLFHEGDPSDGMFIVSEGRIEVVREGPPETSLRVLRRGDVMGELSLLGEGVRTASARAQRDAELLELGKGDFERLIEDVPSFALGLTRVLGAQIAGRGSPARIAERRHLVAVVGLDRESSAAEAGDELADALVVYGTTSRLRTGDAGRIAQAERDSQRMVLIAPGPPEDPWTRLCVAEADVVLAVSTGALDPARLSRASAWRGCWLLLVGARVDQGLLDALEPREVQVVQASQRRRALRSIARRLAGRALGVVLSGGGARALAHIGVLEELGAAGLDFDRVGGVSLGGLIAAAAAMRLSTDAIYEMCVRAFVSKNPTRDFTLPAYSLIRSVTTRRLLREEFGDQRIEELPLRFFCLSCDLVRREPVVHRIGPVIDAVYPSLALPAVFPPVSTGDGRLLVDGGILDNLPGVALLRAAGWPGAHPRSIRGRRSRRTDQQARATARPPSGADRRRSQPSPGSTPLLARWGPRWG